MQSHNGGRIFKFRIQEKERLYYLCSESKGADQLCSNALVICNHAPRPGRGRGIAVEMSGALTAVRGKYPGFALYSSGFTNEQSPQGGAFSRDLLDQKSKSLLLARAWGPWLQITSAYR